MNDSRISVTRRSDDQWPRFVIQDIHLRFWTGSDWSEQDIDALLFHDENRAMKTALELTHGSKLRLFSTTLNVIVKSNESFTVEQLQDFLIRNCKAWIGNDGETPVLDDSIINVEVEWDELNEAT